MVRYSLTLFERPDGGRVAVFAKYSVTNPDSYRNRHKNDCNIRCLVKSHSPAFLDANVYKDNQV
jgi:hypothetical protein